MNAHGAGTTPVPNLIQIADQSNLGVAPHPVSFKPDLAALGMFGIAAPDGVVYDARLHDLAYVWTYGDDYTYTAPQNGSFKQSGSSIGPRGVHVYRDPGSYTVRLDVYGFVNGSLKHAYDEHEVVVADPETIYAGNRTIFVSPSGDWSNCPAGAFQTTSFDTAFKAVQGTWDAPAGAKLTDHLPARIMLNRGEAYSNAGGDFGFNSTWPKSVHVVASGGTGALPVILSRGFSFLSNDAAKKEMFKSMDFVVQGMDMQGPYDSTTDMSVTGVPGAFALANTSPNSVLIDQCKTNGYAVGLNLQEAGVLTDYAHRKVFLNDWVFENYAHSGAVGASVKHFSATGCRITSHPDAYIDSAGTGGWGFRVGGKGEAIVIDACDFYIGQGWSAAGSIIATQPCLRLGDGQGDGRLNQVSRSAFEAGYSAVSFAETNKISVPCNTIFESNYVLGNHQTSSLITVSHGGTTIRNNIMVIPDSIRPPGIYNPSCFISLSEGGTGPNAENMAAPVRVYNNTLIDLFSNVPIHNVNPPFTGLLVENNALKNDGPFVQEPVLWLPRSKGYKSKTQHFPDTFTPADVVWPAAPATGSPAIGSASGLVAIADYSGAIRGSAPSRGARGVAS